ncbi:MAG: hypothetical protein ACRD3K_06480 [Edaphobacter sp.]
MHLTLSKSERFTIALRIPAWAGNKTKVTINGNAVDSTLTPGTWANLDRTWKDADRVELSLDMPLRLAPIDERHPQLVALLHGPVALFAIEPVPQTITSTATRGPAHRKLFSVGSCHRLRQGPHASLPSNHERILPAYQQT